MISNVSELLLRLHLCRKQRKPLKNIYEGVDLLKDDAAP